MKKEKKKPKEEPFVIYGTYSMTGIKNGNKIEMQSMNVNPQGSFGAHVQGIPLLEIDNKNNKVKAEWSICKIDFLND